MKERSLVAFSLLAQMAVGAFWVLGALRGWMARQHGIAVAETSTSIPLLAASLLMLLGVAASFLHLGTPHKAWRAIANLRSSWLSREVLFALLFAGASALVAAMQWFGWGTADARTILHWPAALLGLALLASMANAYRLRTVPAWNTWVTPASFLITAFLLGGLAAGLMLGSNASVPYETLQAILQWLALGTVVLLGVELLVTFLWIMGILAARGAASRAAARITQEHGVLFRARLALMVAAIVVSGAALVPWGKGIKASAAIALAFGLVLCAEVLGRLLFYKARERHGV